MLRAFLLMGVSAFALAGCASLNEQECLVADWYAVGFGDGAVGAQAAAVDRHRKACARHGVAPDLTAYLAGRDAGLREFCQPANGFAVGSAGRAYPPVCPGDLDAAFRVAYQSGHYLYQLEASVQRAEQGIARKTRELEKLAVELRAKEAALVGDAATTEERLVLLDETRAMAEHQGVLEQEILELERDLAVRAAELDAYRETLVHSY